MDNKYKAQRKHDKEQMIQLSFRFNKELVINFKKSVEILNNNDKTITQSSLIKKMMLETIALSKK